MTDTFEFTLNNPLTEEQWDMITDVDFDRTDRITFHTKHGKEVEFAKVIRCKDCIHNVANRKTDPIDITDYSGQDIVCDYFMTDGQEPDDYCSKAEPKERTGDQ